MQLETQGTSVTDYPAMDEPSEIRHEYVNGEIYAMSSASLPHHRVAGHLYWHARKSAAGYCEIFIPGPDLWIASRKRYYSADVIGCCDPGDSDRYVTEPCFIVEVLSPSTAHVDRREKLSAYRTLKSLEQYVLVHQNRMQVTVYRRARSLWPSQILREPDDVLELSCIGMRLPLRDLYDRVRLPPLQVRDDLDVPAYVTAA